MMKKILLINEGGLGNLGDEAIRRCMEFILRRAGCEVDWVSFSGARKRNTPASGRCDGGHVGLWKKLAGKVVPAELRWLLRAYPTFLVYLWPTEYDLVLIGGGQLVQSNGAFGLAMFIWVHLFKKFHKKKVILIGVGAAERFTSFDRRLFSKSLKAADGIYARDRASQSVLENVFGVWSDRVPDAAFYTSRIYELPRSKERRALFCPVSYEFYVRKRGIANVNVDEGEYLAYWKNSILEYLNDNYEVEVFCMSKGSDLPMVQKLVQSLHNEQTADVGVMDICELDDLVREIARSEVVVAARMHALIIGYCYGCTVVPYRTSEKIEAFVSEYVDRNTDLSQIQQSIEKTIRQAVSGVGTSSSQADRVSCVLGECSGAKANGKNG